MTDISVCPSCVEHLKRIEQLERDTTELREVVSQRDDELARLREVLEAAQSLLSSERDADLTTRDVTRVLHKLAEAEATLAVTEQDRLDAHAAKEKAEAEVVRLRKQTSNPAACMECQAEVARLREALSGLLGSVDPVLRGWNADRQLASGQTGMGHNILIEDAGKLRSIWNWSQVSKYVEEARAALRWEESKP